MTARGDERRARRRRRAFAELEAHPRFAPWWTARFRYGPFEWLWRWGTYGVRPRMRA